MEGTLTLEKLSGLSRYRFAGPYGKRWVEGEIPAQNRAEAKRRLLRRYPGALFYGYLPRKGGR